MAIDEKSQAHLSHGHAAPRRRRMGDQGREDAGQWGGIRPRAAECPGSEQRISMGPVAKPEQHPSRVKLFLPAGDGWPRVKRPMAARDLGRIGTLLSAQIRRSKDGLLRFWPLILGVASVKPRDIFEEARKKPKATISFPTSPGISSTWLCHSSVNRLR